MSFLLPYAIWQSSLTTASYHLYSLPTVHGAMSCDPDFGLSKNLLLMLVAKLVLGSHHDPGS